MRRFGEPAVGVLLVCILCSLAVHLPVYEGLGALADWQAELFDQMAQDVPPESEVTFEVAELDPESPIELPDPQQAPEPADSKPVPAPEVKRPVEQPPEPQPEVKAKPAPEPPEMIQRQSVTQRSQNPEVEPPPEARFLARENSRVEEETMARIRNYQIDQEDPAAGTPESESESAEEGNAAEEEVADLREKEGSEHRTATPDEATQERPDKSDKPVAATPLPQVARGGASGAPSQGGPRSEEEERETLTVTDGDGSFIIPRASSNSARRSGTRRSGPKLRLSWSQFESVVGNEKLKRDREVYAAERRSLRRGRRRAGDWKEFRAAIENFVPQVRPGNQTALNAAASPFADYIAAVHRRIHREFADHYLTGLPSVGSSPLADRSLRTKLEIILNQDGSVHRIGIVQTSGFLPFDHGAFASVMRGQPYPQAPGAILSGDSRVYLHWGFYRNERQCGTFNASPFILPNPPRSRPRTRPLRDGPERGIMVPGGNRPATGTPARPGRPGSPGKQTPPKSPATTPRKPSAPMLPPGSSVVG